MKERIETSDHVLQQDLEQIASADLDWNCLKGKSLLITGATGLIGKILTLALLAADRKHSLNLQVYALVRSMEKAHAVFGDLANRTEMHFVLGDVVDPLILETPVNYVFHLASQTVSSEFVTHPVETIRTAVQGTANILALALDHGCEAVVYASSMEAYGDNGPREERTTEQELGYIDPLKVRSCYPESKRMCECMCACYASEYGVPVKIARLAQTFGAGVPKTETRVFAQFARAAINGTDIVLHTAGRSYGNYCYSADAVKGLLTILLRGIPGEAYNVVNEACTMRIAEMAALVSRELTGNAICTVFDIPENSSMYGYAPDVELKLSGQKLMSLGWQPDIAPDMAAIYRRMIDSLRERPDCSDAGM